MFLRFICLMGVVLLMAGCSHRAVVHTPLPLATKNNQPHRQVTAFTGVYVKGNVNVNLHTGSARSQVIVHGDPRDVPFVMTQVANGVLRVTLDKKYPLFGGITVDIYSRYLNSFEYHGNGLIRGTGLRTSLLDLIIDNKGSTTLQGQIGLRKLDIRNDGFIEIMGVNSPYLVINSAGKAAVKLGGVVNLTTLNMKEGGRISLYWVKSKELTIRARANAYIQLAGVVDKLYVELWGSARFNGRYLRAERSFVKTHNKSVAEISAVKRQHTLATDTSDIHFYNLPTLKADFMAFDGAVLDMRDLSAPFLQEYTQYNK